MSAVWRHDERLVMDRIARHRHVDTDLDRPDDAYVVPGEAPRRTGQCEPKIVGDGRAGLQGALKEVLFYDDQLVAITSPLGVPVESDVHVMAGEIGVGDNCGRAGDVLTRREAE